MTMGAKPRPVKEPLRPASTARARAHALQISIGRGAREMNPFEVAARVDAGIEAALEDLLHSLRVAGFAVMSRLDVSPTPPDEVPGGFSILRLFYPRIPDGKSMQPPILA